MPARDGAATVTPALALAVVIAVLATWNVARTLWVPPGWHLPINVTVCAGTVGVAWLAGLRSDALGLGRDALGSGLRLGGIAFALISAVVVVGGAIGLASDDEAGDVSAGGMLLKALVVIPIGTVLAEELAFRSALHGLLTEVVSSRWAVVAVGAVLFGLWHVVPAYQGGGAGTDVVEVGRSAAALGTFVATALAGVVFLWLRTRSDSVVAPVLAHLATNSVTFAIAWLFR